MILNAVKPNRKKKAAIIFDRDGVLNVDLGYIYQKEQISWIPGAIEAVRAVNDAGLYALVATNQSGIARGYYNEDHVIALHHWMNEEMQRQGAHIDAFRYSPYHPDGEVMAYRRLSPCRKPGPGMLIDLCEQFGIKPQKTVMIGDRSSDIEAATAAGSRGILFSGGNLKQFVLPVIEDLLQSLALSGDET